MNLSSTFHFRLRPSELIIFGFAALVLLRTALLMMPGIARENSLFMVDALFMATSAACVTGLLVVDTGNYFTPLGLQDAPDPQLHYQ